MLLFQHHKVSVGFKGKVRFFLKMFHLFLAQEMAFQYFNKKNHPD